MRVLLLSQFYPPVIGGEERHVRSLAATLAARGRSASIATQGTQQRVGIEIDGAVRVHRLRGMLQRVSTLFSDQEQPFATPLPDPGLMFGVGSVLMQERPEIIQAHNWILHSFLPLKRFAQAPIAVTLHDYGLICARESLICLGLPCRGPALAKRMRCANQHDRGIKVDVVAADLNEELLACVTSALSQGVLVVVNHEARGLSDGRNTGVAAATGDLIAFTDDDTVIDATWLDIPAAQCKGPDILGASGWIDLLWMGLRSAWLSEEFLSATNSGFATVKFERHWVIAKAMLCVGMAE